MGRTPLALAAAVLLTGCKRLDADEFQDEYLLGYCRLMIDCVESSTIAARYKFESIDECEAFMASFFDLATGDCSFDAKQAKECLDSVESASCSALDGSFPLCETVYTGLTCPWGGDGSTEPTGTTPTGGDTGGGGDTGSTR